MGHDSCAAEPRDNKSDGERLEIIRVLERETRDDLATKGPSGGVRYVCMCACVRVCTHARLCEYVCVVALHCETLFGNVCRVRCTRIVINRRDVLTRVIGAG